MVIGGFQRFTLSDFPGRSAAIVFTSGCNFSCPWCHNASLITPAREGYREETVLGFLERRRGALDGVVITGGEPTMHDDLPRFIGRIRDLGLEVKLDTNGSRPGMLREMLDSSLLDYIAMDVKAPPAKYQALAGVRVDLADIAESIGLIAGSGVEHEFRTTRVPHMLTGADLFAIMSMIPEGSAHRIQEFRAPAGDIPAKVRDSAYGEYFLQP
ncbi:MAG TPA: anaerobic ribonucleoside-triphosphate reductase activating protein [Candidatus Krumholzibacterium sp.]|nr:anaerobic ribonucleoside-triphosphate reductase activating protein [Candidatus Krumholzibacterium sp.]